MNINKTIEILEALAAGCSPTTGEVFDNESVFNERNVIRALQIAIDQLKSQEQSSNPAVAIDEEDIIAAIVLFNAQERRPTANSLSGFFLGTRKFRKKLLLTNNLYGKYRNQYQKGQLLDFFTQYLSDHKLNNKKRKRSNSYREIDFFRKETFNRLSSNAISQLKEKINQLGIQKSTNLSEYVLDARLEHPRAYESWSNAEKELLSKAIQYTNDLDLLSMCFQRAKGAIESLGQRLIFESKNMNGVKN